MAYEFFDWDGNEFIINLNNFGELEINGLNEGLCIIPQDGFGYYCKDCVNTYKSSKKANAEEGGVN